VAFTSEQNAVRSSPRIGYASRPNGQLTAEVSHLLDLQPCWLLPGLGTRPCPVNASEPT
jgi:hypothetical protein